jgi:anthranilate/para-aminobenzoate synthase component II
MKWQWKDGYVQATTQSKSTINLPCFGGSVDVCKAVLHGLVSVSLDAVCYTFAELQIAYFSMSHLMSVIYSKKSLVHFLGNLRAYHELIMHIIMGRQ